MLMRRIVSTNEEFMLAILYVLYEMLKLFELEIESVVRLDNLKIYLFSKYTVFKLVEMIFDIYQIKIQ